MSLILALLACGAAPEDTEAPVSTTAPADTAAPPYSDASTATPTSGTEAPGDSAPHTGAETGAAHTGVAAHSGMPDTSSGTGAASGETGPAGTGLLDTGPLELPTSDTGGADTGPILPSDTGADPTCVVVVDTAPVVDTALPAVADTASPACPVDTAAPGCPEVDWIIHAAAWSDQKVHDLGVLPDGDLIVLGTYEREFTLKPGEPDEVTVSEGACPGYPEESWLARIGTDGTIRWAKQITASCYSARALELAVAPSGDVVVAGHYWDEPMTVAPGTPEEVVLPLPEGAQDNWWGVFTQDGVLRYARTMPAPEYSDTLDALDVAEDGTIYLAGTYEDHITFDPGLPWSETLQTGGDPDHRDIYIIAYEPDGTLRWAKAAGTGDAGHANVVGIAALSEGPLLSAIPYGPSVWGACEPEQRQVDATATRQTIRARFSTDDGSLREVSMGLGNPKATQRDGERLFDLATAPADLEMGGVFFPQYTKVLSEAVLASDPAWAIGGGDAIVARDMHVSSGSIAVSGEIGHYYGDIGDFAFGCGPTVDAPDDPFVSFNMKGLAWYTFTDAGEPQCGGWFGSVAGFDGQGVVVDQEGGLVIGATWWGDGTIGAGTPAETSISTTDYDIVIVRLATP